MGSLQENKRHKETSWYTTKRPTCNVSEPRRIELELIGIESIEDLAKAEIEKLRGIGEPYVELQRIAELTMNAKKPSPKKVHKPLNLGIPDEPINDMSERS